MRIRISIILGAVLLLSMLQVAQPAMAEPGGQADAATACANGGYLNWVGVDGPFRNPGECMRFVAQGGTLTPRTSRSNGTSGPCAPDAPASTSGW